MDLNTKANRVKAEIDGIVGHTDESKDNVLKTLEDIESLVQAAKNTVAEAEWPEKQVAADHTEAA